ncbi:GNAT family N-acetyltransferase [Deinococcus sp.]|uniref:GNAT family N-acetyltransferase n=1 Tax=Deinococcus sp. TaxID=47478 RepID=UPI002600BD59|nr:GNAT family N-acetyltransferase [Deinococcus sp.]
MSLRPVPLLASEWEAALPLYEVLLGRALTHGDLQQRAGRWPDLTRVVTHSGEQIAALIEWRPDPFSPPGYLRLDLAVLPEFRGRGHGAELLGTVPKLDAAGLSAHIHDSDLASLAWAQRRGFTVHAQRFESVLNPQEFRPEQHIQPLPDGVSLSDMTNASEADWHELVRLYVDALAETPDFRSLPKWNEEKTRREMQENPQTRLSWIIAARSGGSLLGFTAALTGRSAYNQMTAVAPQARGLGLAYALKVELLRRLKADGIQEARTHNHAKNLPMIRVNEKLGYLRQRGTWEVRRPS